MNKTTTASSVTKPLINGTSSYVINQSNNKRFYVDPSSSSNNNNNNNNHHQHNYNHHNNNHMPSIQQTLSPHSPTTSSSSTNSNKFNDALIIYDLNLKLNLINNLIKNNDLMLNCVQFINLIDLYFEDEPDCSTLIDEFSKTKQNDPLNFLYDNNNKTTQVNAINELKLFSDPSTATTTCFPCIVCSNRFSFEQTFHLHLERRSVFIRFFCAKCQAFKSFYNKCKLLYHVYSHKMFLFEPIYKSIRIESISIERLNLSKERNIDFSSCIHFNHNTSDLLTDQSTVMLNMNETTLASLVANNKSSRVQPIDNDNIKIFMRRLIQNKFLLFRCSVCDALFFDLKELKSHYFKSLQHELEHLNAQNTGPNPINRRYIFKNLKQKYFLTFNKSNFDFINEITNTDNNDNNYNNNNDKTNMFVNIINDLSIKKLQFSTRCSTLANMNLISLNCQFYQSNNNHSLNIKPNRPLICPECGVSFDPKTQYDKFRLHITYECMFTCKYDCGQIKCSAFNCSFIAESVNDFVSHWSKAHIKNEHQCDLCDKKGIHFIFENSADSSNNHIDPSGTSFKNSQIYKSMLTNGDEDNESDSNMTSNNNNDTLNEPILSPATISDINKHFFEKHRNMPVSLKLVYRCSCKIATNLVDTSSDNHTSQECIHTTWKACHKHIISLIAKTLASINCLLCNKLVTNNEYQNHLRTNHNLDRLCVCPICGLLKDESLLQNHILKMHYQLNLNDYPLSSFFNLLTTLNKSLTTAQLLHLNSGNIQNLIQSSTSLIPANFSVYQCLNCRLFFASNCKFSHNCWTYFEINKTVDGAKQQASNNNYFSPIYLKFSVNKALYSKSTIVTKSNNNNNNSNNNIINSNESSNKRKLNEIEIIETENNM